MQISPQALRRQPRPATTRALVAAGGAAALLAACGQEDPSQTPQAEVSGGAVGPDATVGEGVKVLAAQLEYPLDGAYEQGEDASLYLGISNTGSRPDTLIDVSGPDFADAATFGGSDVAIEVPEDDNVYVGAEGQPSLILVDLQRSLRSSQSIAVTFTFERAGEVTLDVPVAAEGQDSLPTYDFPDPAEDPTGDGAG